MFIAPPLSIQEREVRNAIEELNQELRIHLRQGNRWEGALRRTTFARNVQGSNTIEGINASVDDINAIAAGEKPAAIDHETEKALAGYQQAMTFVLQLAKSDFELSPMVLRSLHFMATSYDMIKWPGRYRPGPVYVQQERTGDIVHEGAISETVPALVEQLCASLAPEEDDLIRAAMMHLNFVLIHPFKDGNGRVARILQSLMLGAYGEFAPVFMTIEEFLGRRTQAYYDVLAKVGQANWNTANFDPELARPWVRFMLTAHLNQALERKQRIASSGEAAAKMDELVAEAQFPERTAQALYTAMYDGTVTRARYMTALADAGEPISEQTASRDLGALTRSGFLIAHGDRRGRKYSAGTSVKDAARSSGLGYAWRDIDPFE
ncbi:Fic family protein [Leucobacter triazinivorans]|uniref:Fic family protein n=1 Tax=Leucobacter triazinivorans TaxID=1784719 RepID=A0A4V0Z1M0_9MICO|nr:Fic family protein [Leucobacter triazinivorans]QBE48879.1 Fic family protein [Leucobacter triazinivorans]